MPESNNRKDEDSDQGKAFVSSQLVKQTQHAVSEETLLLSREKCLSKLVAKEITNEEPKWLDFEKEETNVKLEMGDLIFDQLIGELASVLTDINDKK